MKTASPNLQDKIKELMGRTYRATTVLSKCKSCGTCIQYCPLDIRKFNIDNIAITIVTEKSCGGCSVCYHRCPNHAIKLVPINKV